MDDSYEILSSSPARYLYGKEDDRPSKTILRDFETGWMPWIAHRILGSLRSNNPATQDDMHKKLHSIAVAALNAFLQSNVTGPPLAWSSADLLFPPEISENPERLHKIQYFLTSDLSVDGEAVYKLIPNIELFCLAKVILRSDSLFRLNALPLPYRWARVAVNFWHQRLLNENAASLQETIYEDLKLLEENLINENSHERARHFIQRATIHTQHGLDQRARDDLLLATWETGLKFRLTGRLGKRTKFQEKDLSQLVVLAKSADSVEKSVGPGSTPQANNPIAETKDDAEETIKPENLNLNDDTLFESIQFSKSTPERPLEDKSDIPPSLAALDPSDQPLLQPLDSIILLAYASSVTNTSPVDGLTREETLPYAIRVLQQGSSNWQIYTQALLVRSRIEAYKSRTVERSVLQLQAVVDQVIVETTSRPQTEQHGEKAKGSAPSSFLPKPKSSDAAPASERLQYIHQLASPTRWEIEAELASRWVSLGGLRTALEIYERLQMWAEVALCWAANEREDKAKTIIRRQLYSTEHWEKEPGWKKFSIDDEDVDTGALTEEMYPLPADAPRLFCILGDLEKSPVFYERAWDVSNQKYARAQRSLGKHYYSQGELKKADEAYAKSLKVNSLNHSTWFSLGCVRLQLEDWSGAVDAFRRAIQIEDQDAESWSNMAAALLQLPAEASVDGTDGDSETKSKNKATLDDEDDDVTSANNPHIDPQKHIGEAFTALKRAAALKRESHRIWQNLLNVSVKLSPRPWTDMIIAQTRLIDLRSKTEGEKCVDVEVMEGLLAQFIAISQPEPLDTSHLPIDSNGYNVEVSQKPGFSHMLTTLINQKITPLITSSRRLWLLTAKLALHQRKPLAALQGYEKAWRVTLNQPGWENGTKETESLWRDVVDATVELVDAYESFGEQRREGGSGEGELVAKDWKFKSRSAVRSVLGRGKEGWEGSEGWAELSASLEGLKG
ncbi:MAG: hypothetical protein Q9170_003460 [Blastenia crenularia]